MSRFLFATVGSLGDLHPYIAVARALVERGHQAVIVSAEEYRAAVERAGVEFSPARPSLTALGDYQKAVARIFDVRRGPERLLREIVMPWLRPAYEDISRASKGADLLVSHPLTLTLQLVAQRQSLPWVATVLSPLSFMSCFDPPVIAGAPWLRKLRRFGPAVYGSVFRLFKRIAWSWERPLRHLRKELGLPPLKQLSLFEGQFSGLLNLALFDPQLAQLQPDWPRKTVICGSPLFEGYTKDEDHLRQLERFLAEGSPPIVFALGSSAVWLAGSFWEHAVAAVREIGCRAVLLTGPATPTSLPDGVKAFSYLPYSRAFPHAAVVVHQGGIGTLSQALRAGRPQLILPLAFDQPDNALRAKALGLAEAVAFAKVNPRLLAARLRLLLSDTTYAERAKVVSTELEKVNGAACAADNLIECLSSQPGPAKLPSPQPNP
jgi:UDP:flavonoid glycosyltransferase YjiC (YdhE family)